MEIKVGQYDVPDGDFQHRYLVYKIMPNTAEVLSKISYKGEDYTTVSDDGSI